MNRLSTHNSATVQYDTKDTIRKYNMVLRHYELTRKWLEEHNWTVTYP